MEHLRRYLAWQDRCFNPDGDGLYENFANFWASDSIQYDGAACSLATANTFFAYCAAEKLAVKLREDPAPFAEKRKNIREAFQKTLWMQEGHPAESIDRTGEGLIHPLASLPTIVTCITSGILSEEQCESSLDYVEKCLEHVVLEDGELVYNTQWAPYQWSVRDVDFADVCHLALCCFLCGRVDKGWSLLRGVIGESCLRSVSPGAFMCVLEGKSVDFSDSSSMFVRAVVEGLFGYRPNALENTMLLAPSFPKKLKDVEWKLPAMNGYWHNNDHAIAFGFSLDGWEGKTTIRIPTERNVKRASWNGRPVPTSGGKYVEVVVDGGGELIIEWEEQTLSTVAAPVEIKQENRRKNAWNPDKWNWVPIPVEWDGKLKDFFSRKYGVRESNRCSLRLPWSLEPPTWCLRGRETIVLSDALVREKTSDGLFYACGIPFLQPHEADKPNVLYLSQWEGFPKKTEIALPAGAKGLALLIAGWTNHMQCGVPNARIVFCKADGTEEEICLMAPSDFRPLTCGPEDERPQDRSCYLRELQRVQIGTFTGTRSGKAYAQVNAFDLSENVGKARIESVSNETVIGLMGVAVGYATLSAASLRLNGGISTKKP